MLESEMNALRELFADEAGKASQGLENRLGVRFFVLERAVRGELGDATQKLGAVLDRLTVLEADVTGMRAQLAGLARADLQRRLEQIERRLDQLEGERDEA